MQDTTDGDVTARMSWNTGKGLPLDAACIVSQKGTDLMTNPVSFPSFYCL
jgi:hypothetical protein